MKMHRWNEGIAPHILNLSIGWRLVINFTHRPLYILEKKKPPVPIG